MSCRADLFRIAKGLGCEPKAGGLESWTVIIELMAEFRAEWMPVENVVDSLVYARQVVQANAAKNAAHTTPAAFLLACAFGVNLRTVDRARGSLIVAGVTFTEAHRQYLAALRRDPDAPAPQLRTGTIADFHAWKAEMRAFDQARIDLKHVTPEQLRTQNAAVRFAGRRARVVRHEKYA